MRNGLTLEISRHCVDSEWDEFVVTTPGGDILQSSHWATFKALRGWSPIRLIVKKDNCVVGGVQVLVAEFPVALKIAQILQGPVLKSLELELLNVIFDHLIRLVLSEKIQYLVLDPSRNCSLLNELGRWGFRPSQLVPTERASLVLDLSQGSDLLLRQMRRTTRNNIRIATDRGITIREANENDLDDFYRLLEATSRRRQFDIQGKEYYLKLWRLLEPTKHVKMFMAEYEGEVLSSLLTIPFGDSVAVERFVWTGHKKWLRPNELLFWKAIDWSRGNGFHNFDFGAINLSLAKALRGDSSLPASAINSNTRFILGFGGSIVLLPSAYEYVPNRLLGWLLHSSSSILGRRNLMKVFHRIRSLRVFSYSAKSG